MGITRVAEIHPQVYVFDYRFKEADVTATQPHGRGIRLRITFMALTVMMAVATLAMGQTDCAAGDSSLDNALPKNMTSEELIQRFTAGENRVKEARSHYTYTQDVLVQTLNDKNAADGQWHEVTRVSYDDKGKRLENVAFSEVSTLRDIRISAEDLEDIRVFMQWTLTSDQLADYKLMYAGQQHVDDLDTYVFHVEPVKEEKNKRYFQGRIWVDNRDLQMVKLCGKSVPDQVHPKKHQPMDVRPTFVGYRQLVDGLWFPAYARVDDTLHFQASSIHVREIVKFKDYARTAPNPALSKQ